MAEDFDKAVFEGGYQQLFFKSVFILSLFSNKENCRLVAVVVLVSKKCSYF
jgi:hypothetical protein